MSLVTVTFVTTGVHAGKTVRLGKYPFQEGRLVIQASAEEVALHARALERNWSVYPEGHPNLHPSRYEKEQDDGKRDPSPDSGGSASAEVPSGAVTDGQGAAAGDSANDGGNAAGAADGPAGDDTNGNGQPTGLTDPPAGDPSPEPNLKLQRAIQQLDHTDNDHWTSDGLPAMKAVEKFYGAADITRAQVAAALPGYNRKAAAAAAAT